MRVEIADLRRVVKAAQRRGRRVVMGGHSLGGSITTAYATWDFGGRPGASGLSGLVYIDGGSSPTPAC
jgi:alpha-beta hydrolase superfamily lysophospholipase